MKLLKSLEQENKETKEIQDKTESIPQRVKNQDALHLIQQWLSDESGYDEETWPVVKQVIEEHRSSYRKHFSE